MESELGQMDGSPVSYLGGRLLEWWSSGREETPQLGSGAGSCKEVGSVVNLCSTCFWEFLVEEEPQWPAARLLRPAVAGGATDRSVCNLSHSLDAMALEKDVCGAAGCGIVDEPGIVNLCSTCFWEFLVEEEPQWPAARLLRPAAAGGATPSSASEVPSADGAATRSNGRSTVVGAGMPRRSMAPHLRGWKRARIASS
ncbi:hypothetical protein BHE74_00036577 [Ensete ventricosum]|nr:hypothetical protein BHE74_00036577 [Ensete ventricosum]